MTNEIAHILRRRCACISLWMLAFLLQLIFNIAYAKNGIYVTLDGGIGVQSGLPSASAMGASRVDRTLFPSAARVGIGYNHDLLNWLGLGLDVGGGWFGSEKYHYSNANQPNSDTHIYSRTLEILAFLQFHVNQQWDIVTKAGGLRQTIVTTGGNDIENETEICPELAFIAFYNFNSAWSLSAQYAHVFGQSLSNINDFKHKTPSLNIFTLGIRYGFY